MASRAEPFTGPTEMSRGGEMRPLSEVLCQVELGPTAGECGTDSEENEERQKMNSRCQWPAGYGATEEMAGRMRPVGAWTLELRSGAGGSSGQGPSQIPCKRSRSRIPCVAQW